MARVNAQEFAQKLARRTAAAVPEYNAGVSAVTEAPGAKAAQRESEWAAGVARAAQENKFSRNVGAVTLQEWKDAALSKGSGRIAQGVSSAEPKMAQFGAELLQAVDNAVNVTNQTPRGDLEQNLNRMNTFVREMAKFRKS